MIADISFIKQNIEQDFATIKDAESLEQFRLKHLTKKGTLPVLVESLREECH